MPPFVSIALTNDPHSTPTLAREKVISLCGPGVVLLQAPGTYTLATTVRTKTCGHNLGPQAIFRPLSKAVGQPSQAIPSINHR
jgi:hypothetical protein